MILPLFAVVALGVYFCLAPRFPKDQVIEVVLGDAASRVTTVRLAFEDKKGDWTSEVELNFDGRPAPRVVHHDARMPDGDYTLEIDVTGDGPEAHVERHVSLRGGTTSVDVSEAILSAGKGAMR